MRVGKLQKIYYGMIPIPETLSTIFALNEGAQLHLAPIRSESIRRGYVEIVVSPVPYDSWVSVCKLSARLKHKPKALAVASRFFRQERINILLTEACTNYQDRAHWVAICDVALADRFDKVSKQERGEYKRQIEFFMDELTKRLLIFIEQPDNKEAFHPETFAKFTTLTGLNDAHFICDESKRFTVGFHEGAITLPKLLYNHICSELGCKTDKFPHYALIYSNTEQRYLVIRFMNDSEDLFICRIEDELAGLEGKGIGVLNQMLDALPSEIDFFSISNYVTEKTADRERGTIELVGHWPGFAANTETCERKLEDIISGMEIEDIDPDNTQKKKGALALKHIRNAKDDNPRIFISYSTKHEIQKLEYLRKCLLKIDCEPLLGTDFEEDLKGPYPPALTVFEQSFRMIPTCVAFISLQVTREDFKCSDRFVLPPWAIAEEVFAWKEEIPYLIRLRDERMDNPRWNQHIQSFEFNSDKRGSFEKAVKELVGKLKLYKNERRWIEAEIEARKRLFELRKHQESG